MKTYQDVIDVVKEHRNLLLLKYSVDVDNIEILPYGGVIKISKKFFIELYQHAGVEAVIIKIDDCLRSVPFEDYPETLKHMLNSKMLTSREISLW